MLSAFYYWTQSQLVAGNVADNEHSISYVMQDQKSSSRRRKIVSLNQIRKALLLNGDIDKWDGEWWMCLPKIYMNSSVRKLKMVPEV